MESHEFADRTIKIPVKIAVMNKVSTGLVLDVE